MSKSLSHLRRLFLPALLLLAGLPQAIAQNCTVNAGVPQTICITNPLVLSGTENGLFTGGNNYRWDKIAGPSAVISSPTSASTAVTNLSAGVYTYRLSALCQDGVRAMNDVQVTVVPDVTLPNAGPDQTVCVANAGNPLQLAANTPNAGASPAEVGSWTANPSSNASFSSVSNPATTFTGNNGTAYNAIWTITNGYCTRRDTTVLSLLSGATTVNAGASKVLNCGGNSTSLSGSAAGLPPQGGLWSIVSGPAGATLSTPTNANTTISNLVPGTYILKWEVSGPCVNGWDTMQIVVQNTNSGPNTAGTTNIAPFCAGSGVTSAVLTAPTPAANQVSAAWTQLTGPTTVTFGTPNSNTTTVNNLNGSGTYTFQYSASNGGCSSSSTYTLSYTQYITNLPNPNPQVLNCGDSSANVPFTYTYGGSTNGTGLNRTATIVSQPTGANAVATLTQNNVGNEVWNVARMSKTGQYVVRFMWSTPCGSVTRDVSFYASQSAGSVNAGSDPIIACNVTQTTMSGNPPPTGVTGTWSQVSGPNQANITQPNNPGCLMTGLVPGVYTFTWQLASGSSCFAPVDTAVAVVSSASVTPAVAGPDDSVCNTFPVQLAANQPGTSQKGTWSIIPAGGVFNNVNIPNAQVTGLAPFGTYHLVWTIANACDTSRDTVVIKTGGGSPQIAVNAGADICRPSGTTSISLNGSAPGTTTPTWTALNGGTIASPNSQNTTVTVPGNGTYRFVYKLSTAGCNPIMDTVAVQVSPSATVANAGADQMTCLAGVPGSATLTGNTPTQGTPTWSLINGLASATIANAHATSTTAGNLYPGVYFFEYKIENGICPASKDTVRVLLSEPPSTAQASTTTPTFCNASSGTIQLNAVAPTVGMGMWSLLSAPANSPTVTINNSTSTNATVDVSTLVTGIYKFKYMVANGPACTPSVDSVTISITRPASSIGTSTVNLCNVTSTILNGAPNTTGTWTVTSTPSGAPTPVITALSSGFQATASNLVQGSYDFTYTTNAVGGCVGSSTTRTYFNGTPASAADAGPDKYLCPSVSTVTLNGNTSPGGAAWTRPAGPSTGTAGTANSNYADTTITNLQQGIYTFKYTTRGTGSCPTESDSTLVIRERTSNAGTDKAVCGGPYATLSGSVPYFYNATWTQISGPNTATIANPAAPTSGLSNLVTGNYAFRYVIDGPVGCSVNADTVLIKVDSTVTYNAGLDTSICVGSPSFTIGTTPEAGVSYAWTPTTRLSAANVAQPTFNPSVEGTYNYLVKATRGACQAQDDIKVVVKPSAITPTFNVPAPACGNGPVTVAINNADPATTYTWFDASNNSLGNGTSKSVTPGTYTVSTVRDGCTGGTGTFTVTYKPIPDSAEFTVPAPVCANATGTVSISNAISGATYTWSGGNGTGTSKTLAPGNYTVSVSKNGCTGPTGSFTLGSKPVPDSAQFSVPTPVCANATGTVSISNPTAGAVYTWKNASNTTVGTGTSLSVAPGTYTVEVVLNGCAGAHGRFTLGSKPVPDSAQFNVPTPVCANATGTVSISNPTAGAVYTWKNASNSTVGTGTSLSVAPGAYTVEVVLNGCAGANGSFTLGSKPLPDSAQFTIPAPVCANATGTVSISNPIAGAVYTWKNASNATVGTGISLSVAPGTYTVEVMNNGCAGANGSFTLGSKPVPDSAQFTVPTPVCADAMGTVSISNPTAGAVYTWKDATNNTVGTGTSLSVAPGTYTVEVVLNGCAGANGSFTLGSKPVPDSAQFNAFTPPCGNGTTTVSIANPAPGAVYTWSNGLGTGTSQSVMPGTYTVAVNLNGCEGDTASVHVGTRAIPSAAFTQDENCKPTFTVTTPTAGATYTWDFGAGATPASYTGMTANQGPIVYSPLGSKTVTLIVTSAAGCADTFSHTFQSQCTPPVAAFAASMTEVCLGSSISFTNTTTVGDTPMTYSYNFGDGSPAVSGPNATYTYTTPGTYTVSFTATNPSGTNTTTQTIVVKPVPNTNFTINQNPQNFTGNLFTFTALGPATNLYTWDFGDGSVGQYATVSRSYAVPGMYSVTLKVTDVMNGCIAYRTQVVTVLSDSVSSGNQGGIESESLGGLVTRRNFNRLKYSLTPTISYQTLPLFEKAVTPPGALSKGTGSQELADMIPANLLAGDVPRVSTPTDLTTLTIAKEVMAVDYTRQNVNKAVVLGIKTDNRAYNHTKSICDRFRGSTLLNIEPITLRGMNFSRFAMMRENGLLEYAIAFDAGVTPGTDQYRVQGDWVIASYAGDKSVYNFQVWATNPAEAEKLATDVLDKQAAFMPLQRYNSGVTVPDVYVTKGVRQKDQLLLTVRNNSVAATTATMNFKVQLKEDGSMTDMEVAVPLKAKTDTVVSLPIGDGYEFDGLMRTSDNILKDQFYLADGNWGLDYDQSYTSLKEWVPANDPNRVYTDNSFPLYRKVQLTAVSTDYLTLYKAIKPGTEPTDLTSYNSLKFHAAGEGKATVRITREGITKWDDQYQTEITLTKEGQDYAIPFSDFTSAANPSANFSAKDAKTLSFTMNAEQGKTSMIELAVSGAEFSKDIVQSPKLMASRNLKVAPNPTKGPFSVTFGSDAARNLTLTVSDLTGRVLMTKEVSATVGSNTVNVNPTGDFPTGTILLVSLRNDDVRYDDVKVSVQ